MSEKRFKLQHINDLTDQEYMRLKKITDNGELITLGEVVDLLNTMSDEIEEVEISIKLFEDDVQVKDKKIEEQQAEIERLQKIIDLTQYQLKVQDRILKEVGE